MHGEPDEFLDEQNRGLAEMVRNFRKARVAAARKAATESAARIKAMNVRVRELARSGVRLTSISQGTAERLIQLQSEIVTAALDDAAAQLQRVADTEHIRDLAGGQAAVLQATRQRIVDDMARAVTILKNAADEVRTVAKRATGSAPAPAKRGNRRKAKSRTKAKTRTAAPGKRRARKTARRIRRART